MAALPVGWLKIAHESTGVGFEPVRQSQDVVQAQIALTSFDLTDEGPMKAGVAGQLFLTLAEGVTAASDAATELLGGWGDRDGHDRRAKCA